MLLLHSGWLLIVVHDLLGSLKVGRERGRDLFCVCTEDPFVLLFDSGVLVLVLNRHGGGRDRGVLLSYLVQVGPRSCLSAHHRPKISWLVSRNLESTYESK